MPGAFGTDDSLIKTPPTAGRIEPALEEMHPSKVHQSTAKKLDPGLRFGFIGAEDRTTTPTKSIVNTVQSNTPLKAQTPLPNTMSSPGFDFKWNRPGTDLSLEAQKIMESVREEATRIRLQMQAERDEQARRDGEAEELFGVGGRKIAKAKRKGGRYSDVHMQEFRKMDSIADHVSSWKNKFQPNTTSLKRTKSKAGFDEADQPELRANLNKSPVKQHDSDRLENTSPGKRFKQHYGDDTSCARPVSRDSQSEAPGKIGTPGTTRFGLPAVMTTPTKASLARAASVKNLQASKIPALNRSKSTKELAKPATATIEERSKQIPKLSRIGSMKSILQRPHHKYSDDPAKVANGTHLPLSPNKPQLDKALPSIPGTPSQGLQRSPTLKRVNFTPTTKATHDLAAASPSPSKIPSLHLPHFPTSPSKPLSSISYPSLSPPNGPISPNPTSFSFRASKTQIFGPATNGLTSPTIRAVRPSGVATPLSAFENVPAIPHGMPNKKRHREASDDETEDVENRAPGCGDRVDEGPRCKRVKGSAKVGDGGGAVEKRKTGAKGGREKGKGLLSLSRLNVLARPKERR